VTFTGFLRCLARQWLRRFRVGVPVPVALVSLARSVAHGLGLATPALDRLASLFALPVMASADDLAELGISLRPLVRGMARSGNDARRRLLAEGRALLMYTLREEPSPVLLRRYVRVRTRLGHGAALFLPALFLRFPSLLSLLASSRNTALSGCLQTAIAIGEASPQGARRYLRLGQASGLFRAIVHITSALATELWWRGLRVCCRPLLRRLRRRSELSE
jgi:NADH dehydrogenase